MASETMNNNHQISGEYADQGYWVKKYDEDGDSTIAVGYKDKEFVAIPCKMATPEILDGFCRRHMERLRQPTGATK